MVRATVLLNHLHHLVVGDAAALVLVLVDEGTLRTPLAPLGAVKVFARVCFWSPVEQSKWAGGELSVT